MNSQSPPWNILKPTPLNLLQKQALEEEEPFILEGNSKEIKFNELLIVLNYDPNTEVTYIKRQVLKCKGLSNIGWINPCLDSENNQTLLNKRSILKQTYNRRLQ
ncbi:unnamed protein product (macronuclear) [Paramecium tetraurelia]|uniref:Uncharacterized protein n=1 Tax=Paramecium tetraurelia TaxID=5888 RepID=A0CNV1_PARTE|nr:uncharacterized protein GSPATT00008910001 [Paramecium tetraurelia]CAK72468.1 unnamed protein product [Paramecium tetraurelia]|eukprot:XP_001439865.1 hypothetical protein (macronuclear) [Paramecium tetraurelia strain d4-2]